MNGSSQYSVFTRDEFYYCIPIDQVREVIRTPQLILAPVRTLGFLGFLDFRQTLCPVIDISSLIRGQTAEPQEGAFTLMVLERDASVFALLIDRFVESILLEEAAPIEQAQNPEGRHIIEHVFRYADKALSKVDLAYLKSYLASNVQDQLLDKAANWVEQEAAKRLLADLKGG